MKIYITIILILSLSLFSCNEDDNTEVLPNNGFTVGTTFYETPMCYIEFDEDDQTEFNLFFLNGRMYDNDTNVNGSSGDYLFTLNTTNFVFYNIRDVENPSITNPYPNIQTGITYTGGASDTVILTNGQINDLTPSFSNNGFTFGEGAGGTTQAQGGTIVINSYSFDSSTQTGSINVDYQSLGVAGNVISGHYEGSVGVIFD